MIHPPAPAPIKQHLDIRRTRRQLDHAIHEARQAERQGREDRADYWTDKATDAQRKLDQLRNP